MKTSVSYKSLCAEFYELDKPFAPQDAIDYYLCKAAEAKGNILEPMCGTGRYLIPLVEKGYEVSGFDISPHMLDICKKKCNAKNLHSDLKVASFESFKSKVNFNLIFIPSSSFCLLVDPEKAKFALEFIFSHLTVGGKFIFEIETTKAVNEQEGEWKCRWIDKPDGSLIVGNFVSRFCKKSKIETILCRYELWQKNSIVRTEVEDFRLRLYELDEIDHILLKTGFKIQNKSVPYSSQKADKDSSVILYEAVKISG